MITVCCRYCQMDVTIGHAVNCPNNPDNFYDNKCQDEKQYYYHISWLENAINNFKNENKEVHTINGDMLISEFLREWMRKENNKI